MKLFCYHRRGESTASGCGATVELKQKVRVNKTAKISNQIPDIVSDYHEWEQT